MARNLFVIQHQQQRRAGITIPKYKFRRLLHSVPEMHYARQIALGVSMCFCSSDRGSVVQRYRNLFRLRHSILIDLLYAQIA